jgi:hypothetical protein
MRVFIDFMVIIADAEGTTVPYALHPSAQTNVNTSQKKRSQKIPAPL